MDKKKTNKKKLGAEELEKRAAPFVSGPVDRTGGDAIGSASAGDAQAGEGEGGGRSDRQLFDKAHGRGGRPVSR